MLPVSRSLCLLAVALLLFAQTARAQIVRVTNGQSLSALIASATAGTTFIVEAGSYGDLTITKRVAIIGPGYFLGSSQQATTGSATFGNVYFRAGSEGSVLMSCAVNNNMYIGASLITVSKSLLGGVRVGHDGNGSATINNVALKQCFVQYSIDAGVENNRASTGILIKNNIIYNVFATGYGLNNKSTSTKS